MIERIYNLPLSGSTALQVENLGKEFFTEGGLVGRFDYEHMVDQLNHLFPFHLKCAMWVSKRENEIVGAIAGMIYPCFFTGDMVAIENFWFVTKSCRGTDGFRLLGEFESWAKESGAKRIVLAHIEAIHPETMGAFYERRGFKKLETNYVMHL